MSSLRVLIVGIGNPWCTDDGFGPAVIEQLDAQADVHDSRCCHRAVHQLMPELAAELTDVDLVVFVDASTDGTSGEVSCVPIVPGPERLTAISHVLEPAGLLQLAGQLYGAAPAAWLVTVRGESFDPQRPKLTPGVAGAVEPAVQLVRQLVDQFLSRDHLTGCRNG